MPSTIYTSKNHDKRTDKHSHTHGQTHTHTHTHTYNNISMDSLKRYANSKWISMTWNSNFKILNNLKLQNAKTIVTQRLNQQTTLRLTGKSSIVCPLLFQAYIIARTGRAASGPLAARRYRGLSGKKSRMTAAANPGAHHDQTKARHGTISM